MRKVSVVIGANYGDEGKGLTTDYLSSRATSPLVVRFNGGAQAGHTVVTPEGIRHVFHHFGSGTLVGAGTFLSRFFLVHPMMFRTEWDELQGLGFSPATIIDQRCLITTPWDVMLNQALEIARNKDRHGSCGLGINETVVRSEADDKYKLTIQDVLNGTHEEKLRLIQQDYTPRRAKVLESVHKVELSMPFLNSEHVYRRFLMDIEFMMNRVRRTIWEAFEWDGDVIFEGAQGLMLDQNNTDNFPHVTRSNTGIINVAKLINEKGYNKTIDVHYITRSYLTRHGAGPLKGETKDIQIVDHTNIFNEHQGHIRYAQLDVELTANEIIQDILTAREEGVSIDPILVVTCIDQLSLKPWQELVESLQDETKIGRVITSSGPTRVTMAEQPVKRMNFVYHHCAEATI